MKKTRENSNILKAMGYTWKEFVCDKIEFDKLLKILKKKYNINIIEDKELVNNCAYAGKDVFIGKYDNIEYLLISIFHEIGHTLISDRYKKNVKYNRLLIEIECWNIGIKEANKMNILFSDDAIAFAYRDKAMTYVGHDERENTHWKEVVKPTLIKERLII